MTNGAGTTSYSYDNATRLTTVTPPSPTSPIAYTWDYNGNLTQRGTDTFAWDFENRLVSATVAGNQSSFTYRGDGLRATRTSGGVTNSYTWDLASSPALVLDDGVSQYVYGAGPIEQVTGSDVRYYLTDGLGSVIATTDAAGAVVNTYTYDAFGATTSSTGTQANDIQFAGQQTDATGLQYLRARYYDPGTGTFISRDPKANQPAWPQNPYGYAGGNPIMNSDPTGECWTGICSLIDAYANRAKSAVSAVTTTAASAGNYYSDIAATVANSAGRCAGQSWCTTVVGSVLVGAGMIVAPVQPELSFPLIATGTAVFAASDGKGCIMDLKAVSCALGVLDLVSVGIIGNEARGVEVVASLPAFSGENIVNDFVQSVSVYGVNTAIHVTSAPATSIIASTITTMYDDTKPIYDAAGNFIGGMF